MELVVYNPNEAINAINEGIPVILISKNPINMPVKLFPDNESYNLYASVPYEEEEEPPTYSCDYELSVNFSQYHHLFRGWNFINKLQPYQYIDFVYTSQNSNEFDKILSYLRNIIRPESLRSKKIKVQKTTYVLLRSWNEAKIYGDNNSKIVDLFHMNNRSAYPVYQSLYSYSIVKIDKLGEISIVLDGKVDSQWIYDNTFGEIYELEPPQLNLRLLEFASPDMLKELSILTMKDENMGYLRYGDIWNYDYIMELQKQSTNDCELLPSVRSYYHWLILDDETQKTIGYISVRPMNYGFGISTDQHQIRLFIDPKGKGYGKKAIQSLLVNYKCITGKDTLWSVVDINNIPMNNLMASAKWLLIKSHISFNDKLYNIYRNN